MRRGRMAGVPVAIVGAGRAGIALAAALSRSRGFVVTGVAARRRQAAARVSRLLGRGLGTSDLARVVGPARVILICVPDREVGRAAEALAAGKACPITGKVVLHTSGALTVAPLAPARRAGAFVGSFHPLVSFPEPGATPPDLRGVTFGLDGEPAALRQGRALARALGGAPLVVPARARGAYHLAASLAANGLVSLLDEAFAIAGRRLRLGPKRASDAFVPLVLSAVLNVARTGVREALTGPVVRGDAGTVQRHLAELSRGSAEAREIYRLLARHALEMAIASRRIGPAAARRMARLLRRD